MFIIKLIQKNLVSFGTHRQRTELTYASAIYVQRLLHPTAQFVWVRHNNAHQCGLGKTSVKWTTVRRWTKYHLYSAKYAEDVVLSHDARWKHSSFSTGLLYLLTLSVVACHYNGVVWVDELDPCYKRGTL